MGYVKITLAIGKSFKELEWENKVLPNLLKYANDNKEEGDPDFETDEDEFEEFYKMFGLIWNNGYYHSEYTIGFVLKIDDSDIRSMQDFNFEFNKNDLEITNYTINDDIMELLGWKKEELSYQIMVNNY